jgi:hypothetical protein
VAAEGWGARLLGLQDSDGRWAAGVYTPKWTSTTYTLFLLRTLGLPPRHPQALRACQVLLDIGFWRDGGINFYAPRATRSETCISSMVLALVSWFQLADARADRLAEHVLGRQMADGGWNCRYTEGRGGATLAGATHADATHADTTHADATHADATHAGATHAGATHGSFHTTILALEALLEYERFRPEHADAAREAQARGREFLLVHRLFKSHRTGKVVKTAMTRLAFPPQWHFDILRGLDYFRASGAARDERMSDALGLLEKKRTAEGLWLLENVYPGKAFFPMETKGRASRWNTLRALRVLKWASSV